MQDFNEKTHLAEALRRIDLIEDCRLKQVMGAFTRHMFAFINEVKPSEKEWMTGIEFLTGIGQMCDDKRQEFILLSDVTGVSMLVDYLAHKDETGATESSVLGPFYREGAPHYEAGETISQDGKGDKVVVSGRVTDTEGNPIANARLDVWQTAPNQMYEVQDPDQPDYNLRGVFTTDAEGRYWLRTVKPVSYPVPDDGPVGVLLRAIGRHPFRPAHIHFVISAPGYKPVATQLFTDDDEYLETDTVFGVKDSLLVHYEDGGGELKVDYDFALQKAA